MSLKLWISCTCFIHRRCATVWKLLVPSLSALTSCKMASANTWWETVVINYCSFSFAFFLSQKRHKYTSTLYIVSLCVSQTKLGVVPDSMAAGLLRAVSRLLDLSVLPIEPVLRFLSHCCLSLLALLITLQQEAPAETNHKRSVLNGILESWP